MSDRGQLPDYPVVVIHMIDPPGSGLAACCGLPWTKPVERKGDVLWACTGCFRWPRPPRPTLDEERLARALRATRGDAGDPDGEDYESAAAIAKAYREDTE